MTKKIWIAVVIFIILTFTSCSTKRHTPEEYYGTWVLETANDDNIDSLLDLGLSIILRLETNGTLDLYSLIDNEKTLLNSGKWNINQKEDYADFQLPDNEYGGFIYGKLKFQDKKLYYETKSATWVFN